MNAAGVRLLAAIAAAGLLTGTIEEPLRAAAPAAPQGSQPSEPPQAPLQLDGEALTLEFIDKAIAERRLKAAGDLILRAGNRYPGPEVLLRQAELMLAADALAEAATAFQALEADPVVGPRALAGRGVTAIRAGHPDAAELLLADAVARDPSLARAWSARAVLADRRHDWASAERFYAAALAAAPDAPEVLNNRGYSRLLQGRHAEAEADFEAALAKQPGLPQAVTNLKLAKAMQGRYAEAFTSANRDELARDLNTIGVAAMLRGDHRIAQSYFARAIDMNTRFDKTASANLAYLKAIAPELGEEQKRIRP